MSAASVVVVKMHFRTEMIIGKIFVYFVAVKNICCAVKNIWCGCTSAGCVRGPAGGGGV